MADAVRKKSNQQQAPAQEPQFFGPYSDVQISSTKVLYPQSTFGLQHNGVPFLGLYSIIISLKLIQQKKI